MNCWNIYKSKNWSNQMKESNFPTFGEFHGPGTFGGWEEAVAGCISWLRHPEGDRVVMGVALVHEAPVSVLVCGRHLVGQLSHQVACVAVLPGRQTLQLLSWNQVWKLMRIFPPPAGGRNNLISLYWVVNHKQFSAWCSLI